MLTRCTFGAFSRVLASADRKSTRLNSSHGYISYAVFCLKKKKQAPVDLSAALTPSLTQFKSSGPINCFISLLLLLQADDHIRPRHATVMAYTCNFTLGTLP